MTIYLEKRTGRFRVEVQLNGDRKRGRFATMREAQAAELMYHAELRAPLGLEPVKERGPQTLLDLTRLASPMLWAQKPERAKDVDRKLLKLTGWIGNPKLSDISILWLDDAVRKLQAEGRAPSTINRYLTALHPVLKWGVKRGYVNSLPEFDWQDEDSGRIRWITVDEECRLLAYLRAIDQHEAADFVTVALDTGCRRGELLAAKSEQVQGGWLHLHADQTKTGQNRSIPLTERARAILDTSLPWGLSLGQLRYAWDKAKRLMGLSEDQDFVLHACRHTCATRLVQSGVNLVAVQQWMGHANIRTTTRYAHVSSDMLTQARDKLMGYSAPPQDAPRGVATSKDRQRTHLEAVE